MVIMENYFAQGKCQELWLKIDQLHLSYLEMEESPEKIDHRTKLEECIAEFLFLADHRDKFVFIETEEVLYRSAAYKKDFSGYKAAAGWNSLQVYASNLLTQPWRKEYRQIKSYCGFYKHHIEANLVGAETLFEAMGYKHIGSGILVLDAPICPDRVANVSRDCLVAYVECQILKHIWEEISPLFNISWLDILAYRTHYTGSIDKCIKNIKFKHNAKQCQQPVRSSGTDMYENKHQPSAISSQISVANSFVSVPSGHNYGSVTTHNHVALPAVIIPPVAYCVPHTNGCSNTFPTYGYGTYPAHMPMIKQPLPSSTPNGYYYPNAMPLLPPVYPVPTGQLIELGSRNGYDIVDEGPSSRSRRSRLDSNGTLESELVVRNEDSIKNETEIGHDDKQDVGENWDYVYKNLERKGYTKDLGERGDLLRLTLSDKQKKPNKESKKVKATNLDEVMNSLSVNDRPLKMTEALEQMDKRRVERNVPQKERRHSQGSSYENVRPTDSVKQSKSAARPSPSQAKSAKEGIETEPSKNVVSVEVRKTKEKEKVLDTRWECKSCTYLNETSKDICDICSKSRHVGEEQPMEVGGPECSKCTLVNPRSAKTCQACSSSLKNSPTYI